MFHTVTYDVMHPIIKKNFVSKTMIMGSSTELYARILKNVMFENFAYIIIKNISEGRSVHTYYTLFELIFPVCQFVFHKCEIGDRYGTMHLC